MGRKGKNRRESFSDRASFIVGMFREQPERKFTLKALAAASGGADKVGRDMTKSILDTLLEQGYIECEGRGNYHLSKSKLPHYQGVADMSNNGNLYVSTDELPSDVFIHSRNSKHALNGDKVEFDKKGRWTNIDCEHSAVPGAVVPQSIKEYVQKQYPSAKILKLELTDRKGYDVELSNDVDIEFDKKFNVIDID